MDGFKDRMMDFLVDAEAGELPTGDLLLAALEALPDGRHEVLAHFRWWVWVEWCRENLPAGWQGPDVARPR